MTDFTKGAAHSWNHYKCSLWIFLQTCISHRLFLELIIAKVFIHFFKVKTIYFCIVEDSKQNWGENTEISHLPLSPTHAQPPPLSISLTWVVHLLKFMNLLHFFSKMCFLYFSQKYEIFTAPITSFYIFNYIPYISSLWDPSSGVLDSLDLIQPVAWWTCHPCVHLGFLISWSWRISFVSIL